jgi:hypothetical protein
MDWGPLFERSSAIWVDLDVGAVQRNDIDLDAEDLSALQFREHSIQHALLGPPVDPGVDGVPVPESGRQTSPLTPMLGDTKDRVDQIQVLHAHRASPSREARCNESELSF